VRIPRPGADAEWGYVKACRKPGEFAHAMAAVLDDTAHGTRRAVIGAVGGAPLVLEGADVTEQAAEQALAASGLDAIGRQMQVVILRRAMDMARGGQA
jgi:carbon-monoxide dehydrogenase medium subunit